MAFDDLNTRKVRPSNRQIAASTRRMRLDERRSTTVRHQGGKITLTPADMTDHTFDEMRRHGLPIGRLETQVRGDETGLPAGTYNLFTVEVDGNWRTYAEAGGRVVREAKRSELEIVEGAETGELERQRLPKPEFSPDGWCFHYCFNICIIGVPFNGCLFSVKICDKICF